MSARINRIKAIVRYSFLLGAMFWCLDFLFHKTLWHIGEGITLILKNLLLPAISLFVFEIVRKNKNVDAPILFAMFNVAVIWMLGPLFMTLANMPWSNSSVIDELELIILGTLMFPIYTWIMSTYHGTLGGVFITTLVLPLYGVFREFKKIKSNNPKAGW